jgi:hypothetical protein
MARRHQDSRRDGGVTFKKKKNLMRSPLRIRFFPYGRNQPSRYDQSQTH